MSIKLVGAFKANKFGTGTTQLISEPFWFEDCMSPGIKVSKFSAGKYTIGIQLTDVQVIMFEETMAALKTDLTVNNLKTGLFGNTLYVKIRDDTDYLEDSKFLCLDDVRSLRNFKGNFLVHMNGVYVDSKGDGFLQIFLSRLLLR